MKEPNIHDELRNIAPELSKMKSSEGYSVPPVYFKELQDKVMGKIQNEQKAPAGSWFSEFVEHFFTPRYALALATVALIIVAGVVLKNGGNETSMFASISVDDAYEYVYNNIDEYETVDLYTLTDTEYADNVLDDFSNEELNYAIDALLEDIDSESLEELF